MMEARLASANLDLLPGSLVQAGGAEYCLVKLQGEARLAVLVAAGKPIPGEFEGQVTEFMGQAMLVGPLSPGNAAALRRCLAWLQPRPIGLRTSAGTGDRLGIATPGHVRAFEETQGMVAPIFAQQSIREMTRTGRTPQQVMDDATWGIFEAGWQEGIGADADHLKTTADIDACLGAGYTFFTIDPGDHVDNQAQAGSLDALRQKAERLPPRQQLKASGLVGRTFEIEGLKLQLDESGLLHAAVKYGRAIGHVASMYAHLQQAAHSRPFEVEVSMDETEQPTTPTEHIYIASELRRLGVEWVSFAPRFVGSFEKGVDYIGDVKAFEADLAVHAAIARQLGPYKLSLHSGSDKFSLYAAFMHQTRGLVHLKTAGTSYLEALRTIAEVDSGLMKEIYAFALTRFETDRHSYHLSAQLGNAPPADQVIDWQGLFSHFDARQILHATFGSVLTAKTPEGVWRFRERIFSTLQTHRERYFSHLAGHFRRHLQPFCSTAG